MSPLRFIKKDDILRLGETDPQYAAWQEYNSFPPMDWTDIQAARSIVESWTAEKFQALGDSGVTIEVPMRDGFRSSLRVYRPEPLVKRSILVILLHGGAFVTGDNRELAEYALALRALYGATIVLPSYRLAPEHPFPTAQYDIWDTLDWLSQNATSIFGADLSSGFVVGGVSAGANLAATVGQKWADEDRAPKMTGLWLSIPFIFSDIHQVPVEYHDVYLSRKQNIMAPMNGEIPSAVLELLKRDVQSPWYSPFNSFHPQPYEAVVRNRTRVYFQAAGQDFYRDDALVYERILWKHGVETELDVYPGLPHGHFCILPFLSESRRCNSDILSHFAWLLRLETPPLETVKAMVQTVAPSISV
ncbi:lipase/esterase [Penicillium canescens]|uniref:Lipase/esterase n=1 Tax=Penicillium canescens TaxID=5083 RepID=A0AAD6I1N6_PENCN|nr:lipase/esterase [Penicillium canescens]KAJ6027182.1 lipase/esterase [Penicillium canescens]KAJ6040464.1 lipase/esterase [Penicillium canescens]KAJ6067180.1 lipase/esterase [Penicillium canescens]